MTKTEQNRVVAWRLKLLRQASDMPRSVAQTCRHFGLSRKTFYKWRARYKSHGEAGLCDRPRVPQHFPKATPRVVISKILYLTGSLSLWTRQDRQLFAALSSSGGGTLHGTSHSDPLRSEPATGQPEASADRPALEAIREATARAPRTSGCEVPRADRRL